MMLTEFPANWLSPLKYWMGFLCAMAALPLLFSRRNNLVAEKTLFGLAIFGLIVRSAWRFSDDFVSWDLIHLWSAGRKLLEGRNPYEVSVFMSPISSLAFYRLFALLPLAVMTRVWLVVNTLMLLVLPYASWRVLKMSSPEAERRTGPFPYAAAACVLLSMAAVYGLDAGQAQLLTSLLILAALGLKSRARPLAAGVVLAMATLKIGMMIPILTQFCGRREWRAWIGLAAGVLGLSLLGTPIGKIPDWVQANLVNISGTSRPMGHDDYVFENPISDDLISVARWAYCLGVRDRAVIKALELGILAALGCWLTWASTSGRLPTDAGIAVACAMGTFFLYHRMYDTVLLAPTLIYCTAALKRGVGGRRIAYGLAVIGLLAVMNMNRGARFMALCDWSLDAGVAGRVVQIVLLPYAMWVLFGVVALIGLAPSRVPHPSEPARAG